MALATLTARVDESDKSAFDSFCNSVGLTTSAAINMYVKAVLRERRIPFDIKQDDPFYSASNQAYIMLWDGTRGRLMSTWGRIYLTHFSAQK